MSLTKFTTVHCDGVDPQGFQCLAWDNVGGGGYSAKEARGVAKSAGWTHFRGKDYCPHCWVSRRGNSNLAPPPPPDEEFAPVEVPTESESEKAARTRKLFALPSHVYHFELNEEQEE